jgi:hypothetical protein
MLNKITTKVSNKPLFSIWLGAVLVLLAFFFYTYPSIAINKISSGNITPITVPYFVNGAKNTSEQYKVTIQNHYHLITHYQIVPDDCVESLKINNTTIQLNSEPNRCNYSDGFSIDLSPYNASDEITIDITIQNSGGKYGINFFPNFKNSYFLGMLLLFSFVLLPFIFKYLHQTGLSKFLSLLLILAIALRVYYFYHTPYYIRTHDVDGHLDYIMYIVQNIKLPHDSSCWQCYHPSLYYVIAAAWYHLAHFINILQPYKALQLLSLFFSIGFLLYGVMLLKEYLLKPWTLILISVLFLYWPSLVIHSARIGNDSLLYFAYIASFFHFIRFLKTEAKKHFVGALVFASMAFMAKTNGIIIMVIIGVTLFARLLMACGTPSFKTVLKLFGVMVFSFVLTGGLVFGPKIYDRINSGAKSLIVSNSNGLGDNLRVGDSLNHFIYFDLKTYINEPYIDPWRDESGRQYFWNYLLKSSVFGEFNTFISKKSNSIATAISISALIIFVTSLVYLLLRRTKLSDEDLALTLNLLISVSALMYLRATVPFSCSNDFRYILPILFSVLIFHGYFLEKIIEKRFYTLFGSLLCVDLGMIFLSVYFML